MADQVAKAQELLRLHLDPEALVLVNVWDAASARTVAEQPGCRAIATASASIAWALGVDDGEELSREEMLAAVERIIAGVDLPVSADLESGYGATAAEVGVTVAGAVQAGAVGCNLEDTVPGGGLRPVEEAAERIAAARAAAENAGVPLVINARTDVLVKKDDARVEDAIDRGRAYVDAGADCVFVLGASDPATIRRVVTAMGAPVAILAGAGGPSVHELAALGVARISFGPGPMGVAYAALARAAADLLSGGVPPPDLRFRPPGI
jgi:2-methylisocitrate lyase-like PEP mutase family enzyme